jgi:hypothetical protein
MSTKKEIGEGKFVSRQLSMKEKLLLGDWVKDHGKNCHGMTYEEIAVIASKSLGYEVNHRNVATVWVARFGNRNAVCKADRIKSLEIRIADCERRLAEAGA